MIYIRKPFAIIDESGLVKYAIVSYKKIAVCFEVIDRGAHPDGRFYNQPVGWRSRLFIDLWLILLEFKWESGEIYRV